MKTLCLSSLRSVWEQGLSLVIFIFSTVIWERVTGPQVSGNPLSLPLGLFCHGYCSKCIFLSSSHSLLCRLFTPSETVSTVDGLLAAEMPMLVSPFYPAVKWLITNISSAPWLTLAYPLRLLFLLWDTVSIRNSSMAHCSQASSVYVSFDFSYKSFSASWKVYCLIGSLFPDNFINVYFS